VLKVKNADEGLVPRTVVLTGGGTAGHVLPNVALLPHLREKFDRICYIGSTSGLERKLVEPEELEYFGVPSARLRRGFGVKNMARNAVIPFRLLCGVQQARRILVKLRPAVVFSKGGFVAYPVVRAAAKLGIPVIAHESDKTMGLANRMSVRHCVRVCTTFKGVGNGDKFIHTGAPIRAKIYEGNGDIVARRHNLAAVRNLLVLGGSLGASSVNKTIRDALPALVRDYNVIHICGKGKTVTIEQLPKLEGVKSSRYVQLEYVNDIQNYLAWADIVVSRAGSNALCELMVLGKPVLFIPLATGRGDQLDNVKEVLRHKAAVVLYEQNLDKESLKRGIEKLWRKREDFSRNARLAVSDGTKTISDTIYGVVCDTYKQQLMSRHGKLC